MNHYPALRQWVRDHPIHAMVILALVLIGMQAIFSEATYTRISIFMIFLVFAFKSWVNLVFSVTTHRQHGETELSIASERYFWSLLCQSLVFSFLFFVAFLDAIGVEWFGRDLVAVRNFLRSIAIVSVIGVIIYGDQTLEALRGHILREKERPDVSSFSADTADTIDHTASTVDEVREDVKDIKQRMDLMEAD